MTLSTKGQIVLPVSLRRNLGLRPGAKLEIEERDGGLFIRAAGRLRSFVPIEYVPAGAIKLTPEEHELMQRAGEDDVPHL